MTRDYLFGEPRETGSIVRLDDYRVKREPETFRQIGDVAADIVKKLGAARATE